MSIDSTLARQMPADEVTDQETPSLPKRLPWIVAAVAFVVYALTLNHSISFSNIAPVAKVSGWTWQPELSAPVYWLLTYPLRWFPHNLIPLLLNLLSAVLASITLGLLARSVCLLPHDRTQAQRDRSRDPFSLLAIPNAWLPPVLAAILCGFQLSFWEAATNASTSPPLAISSHMLDLCLLAYVVRCVLEFRIDENDSWLTKASFVVGLGMTNDWAMIAYLPLFLVAVLWVKGFSFFNARFLGRMFLCGVLGLLFYLLLPLVQSFSGSSEISFWNALRANLGSQKYFLGLYLAQKPTIAALSLTSVLPLLVIGIRWSSYFGDTSAMGVALAKFMFHVVHGLFFVACVWIALDPPVSPRNQGLGLPFLSFYYLGALCAAYFAGYFLLVFGTAPLGRGPRRISSSQRLIDGAIVAAVWIVAAGSTLVLLAKNLPEIRFANGPAVKTYAQQLVKNLPPAPAVVLSDDVIRLMFLQSALTSIGKENEYVLADTASLKTSDFHRFLQRRYGSRWPVSLQTANRMIISDDSLVSLVGSLAQNNTIVYLHPSFGYYFEQFYLEPHGLLYYLRSYAPKTILAPPLSPEVVAANEAFWKSADQSFLAPVIAAASPGKKGLLSPLFEKAHLKLGPSREASNLGAIYSCLRNFWGVQMQKTGDLVAAGQHFARALDLNPDNPVAQINAEFNERLRENKVGVADQSSVAADAFSRYRTPEQIIGAHGPFDHPFFSYEIGKAFYLGRNYRQAAIYLDRAATLAPDNVEAQLGLGMVYVMGRMPDVALDRLQAMRNKPELQAKLQEKRANVLYLEMSAQLSKQNTEATKTLAETAMEKFPGDTNIVSVATQVFITAGMPTNALEVLERHLKSTPKDISSLLNEGYLCIQLGRYEQAIPAMTKVLALETNNADVIVAARLNRAIASLQSNKLDDAKGDYEQAQTVVSNYPPIFYGLGEIAYRKKDFNGAIKNYELYLANSKEQNDEVKQVQERLAKLKSGSP